MKRRLFDHSELIELCEVPGISGREERVREKISIMLGVKKSELKTDKIGNLIFEKKGLANEKEVLLMAHMDEIGFYVSSLRADGKLEVRNVGGIIEETLPGSFV